MPSPEYTPTREVLEELIAQQNRIALLCRTCGALGKVEGRDGYLRCVACYLQQEARDER